MCDYSLQHVLSRPAKVGDRLTTREFNRCTRGFSALKDRNVAVCLLPGTELSFTNKVRRIRLFVWSKTVSHSKTAIFRKINQDKPVAHHDALEFPNGKLVPLTYLEEGQRATVLQLPAEPKTAVESIIGRVQKLRELGHGADVFNFQDVFGVGVRGEVEHGAGDLLCGQDLIWE